MEPIVEVIWCNVPPNLRRGAALVPEGVPRDPQGVPRGPQGSQGVPKGSQGVPRDPKGSPRGPKGSHKHFATKTSKLAEAFIKNCWGGGPQNSSASTMFLEKKLKN